VVVVRLLDECSGRATRDDRALREDVTAKRMRCRGELIVPRFEQHLI